ncbi:MAG: MobA/MobL family protein [Candidatus Competibacter sp.]
MALARLSMKLGKAGKAAAHAAYIAREAQYAHRLQSGERLEAKETGNLPAWAEDRPNLFWQAADRHERANGTTYREMEIALPRELTPAQRLALVRGFVLQELGARHAYQWAIHNPKAADGDEQPHVHLMFSERRADGIERDPERYFRRHNPKAPEKGGARKGYGPYGGGYLSKVERVAHLKGLRQRWEIACNAALADAGHAERIDLRSHAERGLTAPPERKQLPSQWRQPETRAAVLAFRQARAERAEAQAAVNRTLPNPGAAIIQLDAERQRQAEEATLLALKDAKTALLAEIPMWTDAGVLEYADQVMAQNRTAAEQRASIHRDLTHTLIHDVTRMGHPPTSLPAELFEAAADDCLGPMVARCRQARTGRERQAEVARQAEAAEAERQRQAEVEAEEQRIRQAEETERQRQAEAERQRLLAVDVSALMRQRAQWQTELERLQQIRLPSADRLATGWSGLPEAQAKRDRALQQLNAVTEAFNCWNGSAASWFGLKLNERRAWDARIQQAKSDLDHATEAVAAAQQRLPDLLPQARAEAQRRADEQQRRMATLRQQIADCEWLMKRAATEQSKALWDNQAPELPPILYPKPRFPAPGR